MVVTIDPRFDGRATVAQAPAVVVEPSLTERAPFDTLTESLRTALRHDVGATQRRSPQYARLAEALVCAIAHGLIPMGARLPSDRDLARGLGVSRTTTVSAYQELAARGLVRGQVGRGTYVCASPLDATSTSGPRDVIDPPSRGQLEAPFAWRGKIAIRAERALDPGLQSLIGLGADPAIISFAAAVPALDHFPTTAFQAATERAMRSGADVVKLPPVEGLASLRSAIATRSGIEPARVLIVSGAQQGLDLIARCLVDPGDTVILDRPGYLGAIQAFRAAGAHLVGWDMVRRDFDELEDLFLRYRPKLLCVSPTFQNPTGRVLGLAERRELLALAARYRVPIVEDDPYRDLPFPEPTAERLVPPTLAALDPGDLVVHLGTFSKTLAGGLRLGWVAASPAIIEYLARLKANSDVGCPTLTQATVAELLTRGSYDAHLTRLRGVHRERHDAMVAALERYLPSGSIRWRGVQGGLYLWVELLGETPPDTTALLQRAIHQGAGVAFLPGDACYSESSPGYPGPGRKLMRLSFSAHTPDRIDTGVRRLARLLGKT